MAKPSDIWLCIRFTHLSLNSLGIKLVDKAPSVVTASQNCIWQHNSRLSNSPICAGMTTNHAQLLIPTLEIQERQSVLEQEKLTSLAHWAYQFTSLVSIHDQAILLEIGKSIKLFNGLNRLLNLITHDLKRFYMGACLGLSHTPQAALLVSFNKPSTDLSCVDASGNLFLAELHRAQIEHLAIESKSIKQLRHCGFINLGDLSDISNNQLGNRFGVEFLNYLDRLYGRVPDVQEAVIPPETFTANIDFAEPISNITWITQQLERLLVNLCAFIRLRQLVCQRFTWHFYDEKNRCIQSITISLSQQSGTQASHVNANADRTLALSMLELTQLKIDTVKFSWSISRIELLSKHFVAKQLFYNDLFDPKPDQQAFTQLLDKLVNRLGRSSVLQLQCHDEQLPEHRNNPSTLDRVLATQTPIPVPAHQLKDQPLWLLSEPQFISKKAQPDYQGPLQIIHGPDRIVSHWWSNLQSRDYYIARQRNGRLLWLFFNRKQRAWFLHGLFA